MNDQCGLCQEYPLWGGDQDIELAEVLEAANDSQDRAEGRGARAARPNVMPCCLVSKWILAALQLLDESLEARRESSPEGQARSIIAHQPCISSATSILIQKHVCTLLWLASTLVL
jgi:hypothetical protein